ncbi:hypothetical protein Ddye_021646 [Dipteronia dyeriana]|uniref:Pectinesterase n=1 Tax=Dipteronia dyeriana TaxID=168575 RepID=A0AAD9U215_9ROSI|nr:hypothetical protein Ddye_021646 [Dipteronia dyeriana]
MRVGKGIAAGASILVVVAVCVGLIAGFSNKGGSKDGNAGISTTSKAVAAICAPTDYKEACVKSLSAVSNNQTANPKDFIQAAILATIDVVKEAMNQSGSIFNSDDKAQKMAKDDCEDLLSYAVQELQASFSMVGDSDLHTMKDREAELKNWLSAVISYQQTCLDGVADENLKTQMSSGLLNATELTSNALAIVSAISGIFNAFNIPTNMSSSSRRLLEADQTTKGEYPGWISPSDRRLLAGKNNARVKPNAVVAKDGTGQYKTIAAALAAYPKNLKGRYVIYVKAGVYNEYITVTKDQTNVFMYGDGPRKTIVTGRKNYRDGVSTYQTASFAAIGTGFIAKSMGFQNTAGPAGHQAVALRVQSDMSAFYNCRMDGYQDTLYAQTHRQFYRNCVISGTVDFIFGDSATVIQNSLIIVRKPMDNQKNIVTAHGRQDKRESTGLVIQNCRIVPEQLLYPVRLKIPTYLGRPWKMYSRTIIMESTLSDFIQPEGFMPWEGNFALDTLYYAEYGNRGPGAATNKRVKWKGYHVLKNRNEVLQFTAGPFLQGNMWLKNTGAPYILGLKN